MSNIVVTHKRLARWPIASWCDDRVVLVAPRKVASTAAAEQYEAIVSLDAYKDPAAEAVIERAAREHAARRVAGVAEVDVLRLARIRDRLDIGGMRMTTANAFTDKLNMRLTAQSVGLMQPKFFVPTDARSRVLMEGAVADGRQLLAKPRIGSGATGIERLRKSNELASWMSANRHEFDNWVVEEWVEGSLCHVDGLTRGGAVVHAWPSQYSSGALEANERTIPHASWMLDPNNELTDSLLAFARSLFAGFPPLDDLSAFHLEAFDGPDGVALCEVAVRPAGGGAELAYQSAFGFSFVRAHIRGQLGMQTEVPSPVIPTVCAGWVLLPALAALVEHVPALPPAVEVVHSGLPSDGSEVQRSHDIADAAGLVIVSGADEIAVRDQLRAVDDWWQNSVEWSDR